MNRFLHFKRNLFVNLTRQAHAELSQCQSFLSRWCPPKPMRRSTLVALIAAILIGGALPASAGLSPPTGQINGQAPTATGTVSILMPDGENTLADSALIDGSEKPNEFTLAPLSPGVVYSDADGDVQGTPGLAIAPEGVVWVWKGPTGDNLTAQQLKQTFATNFARGATLTVQANVPVVSTSLTGAPTTSVTPTTFITPPIRVKVKVLVSPEILVAGYTYAFEEAEAYGIPQSGFVGAQLHVTVDKNNAANLWSDFELTTNQPGWTAIGQEGEVTLTRMPSPTEKEVTLTLTHKDGLIVPRTLTLKVDKWFESGRGELVTASEAVAKCGLLGSGYRQARADEIAPITRTTNATHFRVKGGGTVHDIWGNSLAGLGVLQQAHVEATPGDSSSFYYSIYYGPDWRMPATLQAEWKTAAVPALHDWLCIAEIG